MAVVYLTCVSCQSRHRVERIAPIMVVRVWRCPGCGEPAGASQNHDEDYWYTLAGAHGLPQTRRGVRLIKEIYASWDTDEFRSFRDYVDSLRQQEPEQEQELEDANT